MEARSAAEEFVRAHFPECSAAFLAGSVVRGGATPTSDLDVVILTDRADAPLRESFLFSGWPIEAFVHTRVSLGRFFRDDIAQRKPSLPMMCQEGIILRDRDGVAKDVKVEASALILAGPAPLSESEIEEHRYAVTDCLDDFVGCERIEEGVFIAALLTDKIANFTLAYHCRWSGDGKWLRRALERFDLYLADEMTSALRGYCRDGDKEGLIRCADDALQPVGGRHFEGFRRQAPPDSDTDDAGQAP